MKVDFKQGAKAEKRSGFSLCYVAPVMQFSYSTILKGNVHYTVCKNSVSECQFGCVILKMVGPKLHDSGTSVDKPLGQCVGLPNYGVFFTILLA